MADLIFMMREKETSFFLFPFFIHPSLLAQHFFPIRPRRHQPCLLLLFPPIFSLLFPPTSFSHSLPGLGCWPPHPDVGTRRGEMQ
jgi:hypothetical protein